MSNYRCPHCGGLLALPEPQQEYHTRLLPDSHLESFDFSVPQHYGKMEHATALPAAYLAPGEKHEARSYHRWELGDVKAYGSVVGLTVVIFTATAASIYGAFQVTALWWLAVGCCTGALAWLGFLYMVFDNDRAISHVEEHERYPEPTQMPQAPAQPPVRVVGEFLSQQGHVKRISTIELTCDPEQWRQFCQDVDNGRCNFSGRAAQDHGLTPDEWTEALTAFHLHKWLASLGTDRTAPVLNRAGRWVVRQFATS